MDKISAKQMAKKVSKLIKPQNPNYDYLLLITGIKEPLVTALMEPVKHD